MRTATAINNRKNFVTSTEIHILNGFGLSSWHNIHIYICAYVCVQLNVLKCHKTAAIISKRSMAASAEISKSQCQRLSAGGCLVIKAMRLIFVKPPLERIWKCCKNIKYICCKDYYFITVLQWQASFRFGRRHSHTFSLSFGIAS